MANLTWTATTSIPLARRYTRPIIYRNFMYVLGGYGEGGVAVNTVYYAPVSGSGSVGSWSTTTALPLPLFFCSFVASGDYLYCIGGRGAANAYSTVYRSLIDANGTLGAWSATGSLNTARQSHESLVVGSYIITAGGANISFGAISSVEYQLINGDGTLTAGTPTTDMPATKLRPSIFYFNSRLHVIGGTDFKAYHCALSGGAVSGGWTTGPDSPVQLFPSECINGVVYGLSVATTDLYLGDIQVADNTIAWQAPAQTQPSSTSGDMSSDANGILYELDWVDNASPTGIWYANTSPRKPAALASRGGFSAGINTGFN